MYVLEDELPESMLEQSSPERSKELADRIRRHARFARSLDRIPELFEQLAEQFHALAAGLTDPDRK